MKYQENDKIQARDRYRYQGYAGESKNCRDTCDKKNGYRLPPGRTGRGGGPACIRTIVYASSGKLFNRVGRHYFVSFDNLAKFMLIAFCQRGADDFAFDPLEVIEEFVVGGVTQQHEECR